MCLSALLLCSLVVLQCMCSDGAGLSRRVIFEISYGQKDSLFYDYDETGECPWMASSLALVKIQASLPSFSEHMNLACSSDLKLGDSYGPPQDAIIRRIGGRLDQIRDNLFGLLFSREAGVDSHPPTVAEISEICAMCEPVLQYLYTITFSDHSVRGAWISHATDFVVPTVDCWVVGDKERPLRVACRSLHQKDVVEFVTKVGLAELAARIGVSRAKPDAITNNLFPICHRNLVIYSTVAPEWDCISMLPFLEDPSLDTRFESVTDVKYKRNESFDLTCDLLRFQYYLKATESDGRAVWRCAGDEPGPFAIGLFNKLYLSPTQARVQLEHIESEIKAGTGKIVKQYNPRIVIGTKEPIRTEGWLLDIMVIILGHSMETDPSPELRLTCKRMLSEYYSLCSASTLIAAARRFRRIRIPTGSLAQFALGSLATIASGPEDGDYKSKAVKRLSILVVLYFSLLRKNLVEALERWIAEGGLPSHLSGYSETLSTSRVLTEMVECLNSDKLC